MSKVEDNVAAAIAAESPRNKPEEVAEADPNTVSYGALHFRRRLLRTKHVRYQKTAKELVSKLSEPGENDTAKDAVKYSYSLLRVFSLTYNFINLEKDDDKAVIPTDFSDELKQVLTEANFDKFSSAFKGPKEEYDKCLPETIEKSVSDRLIKFVQAKESDQINARYEKELAELTTQIDARKNEPRPKQVKKRRDSNASADKEKSSPASRKGSKKSSPKTDEESLEDQMTSLLKKINDKSRFIKLQKDDFESYSDAQSQFDLLFDDVATEILKMKRNLRNRFNKVQSGKFRVKKPRNRSESANRSGEKK